MKAQIRHYALTVLGVDDLGFGAVDDYQSPLSPKIDTFFPKAKTLIVMAFKELANCESDNAYLAMGGRLDAMEFIRPCNYKLARYLEKEFAMKAMSTPPSYPLKMSPENRYGLIAEFSQRHAAFAAGLGTWGRNNLILHPKFGARVLFCTIISDVPLPPDKPCQENICNNCNICVEQCPGHALDGEGKTNEILCLKHSQPFGIAGNMRFWKKFAQSDIEEQKKMVASPEFMSLYQASFIGFQYFCFNCTKFCPIGTK
ncbi:MAG: epoxyqueuosine reductase [Deltaproteobacteria bacterium]|nr:epoxyqueuosine reductase [Deltaproteobacteria bacterium]